MKKSLLLIFWTGFLLSSKAPQFKSVDKKITDNYVPVPAGTLNGQVISEFYISAAEVSNQQYREFLNDLRATGTAEQIKVARVDTAGWVGLYYNEPYRDYYFQHPAYSQYPVGNVSKEGAQLYCDWLTKQYNAQSPAVKVKFALPTEAQWVYAAKGGNNAANYPWDGDTIVYLKKGKYFNKQLCNYRRNTTMIGKPGKQEAIDITAPCGSYLPNKYGIYNMSGNVAEMVSDKNYVLGGSWNSTADKIKIGVSESMTGPSPTVGFRPVMVVLN